MGPVPRANVSVKISSLAARVDPIDAAGSVAALSEALMPILEAARTRNVLINFDMEQCALKDLTLDLFERSCEAIDFPAGIAIQAYLRSVEDDVRRLVAWARRSGRLVTVRLVKGAYWDYEVIHAKRMGWPVPVWTSKRETDASFERLVEILLAAAPRRAGEGGVKLALGSHNVRSIARGLALLRKFELPDSSLEIQMLYGMADQLKAAVLGRGLRLRQYVPVGEMLPGMAYLVRRLLENTSNQSWLRAGFFENVPDEDLLASPSIPSQSAEARETLKRIPTEHPLPDTSTEDSVPGTQYSVLSTRYSVPSAEPAGRGDGDPFINEPPRDFSQAEVRRRFAEAIGAAGVPEAGPARSAADLDAAIGRVSTAFSSWRDRDPLTRSQMLAKAAAAMRARRDELSGIVIRESGKTWREADADVCEAIDFCEYYARTAVALFRPQRLGRFAGELNEVWHEPRGVAGVISPWNFPLSICTGMTTAALVTGNTVLVKPSTQTPGIAAVLCKILWNAGVPPDVLQFVPGSGQVIGAGLVRDPRVALIAFTGSKEVGLDIFAAAGQTPPGQRMLKKVVCEMGGKNAIIVDESADLDEAVLGVRQSAFSYSGQKCSACSRAIVVDTVYSLFLRRLVESTRSLVIGDPLDPGTDIGPVIDKAAVQKIREYIDTGRNEGRLELACEVPAGLDEQVGKPYLGPHIFSGIEPHHRLAQEEIFGPVLSVMRAASFEQALDWANASTYKLTGGAFSRKPSHLERAKREFRVGNLYLNRGITGALVGRQPFGGFGLSGAGTQAGGPEYLLNFVQPRCVSENTLRHGFAPELE
jgi:RHH-type proline utilization regulon transcriptional repressor/proline dehydrogenase/delta 1-pyrroline-5-carboxylate dehydrogenase